jgi:hypothetical protein
MMGSACASTTPKFAETKVQRFAEVLANINTSMHFATKSS